MPDADCTDAAAAAVALGSADDVANADLDTFAGVVVAPRATERVTPEEEAYVVAGVANTDGATEAGAMELPNRDRGPIDVIGTPDIVVTRPVVARRTVAAARARA